MSPAAVIYIPHGGGPLPLLGEPSHVALIRFLRALPADIARPEAVVVISAHWEESRVTVTSGPRPPLVYDYHGFPPETYLYDYPAPGQPRLAQRIRDLLRAADIEARLDPERGFDHGLFVPLMLMYPEGDLPCVQVSLSSSLDAGSHIRIGSALRELKEDGLLILGSGFSFHNLQVLMSERDTAIDGRNQAFETWLAHTCCDAELEESERSRRLAEWTRAPHARYCHPREEHLLPLHVCYGVGGGPARQIFEDRVAGFLTSAYRWS